MNNLKEKILKRILKRCIYHLRNSESNNYLRYAITEMNLAWPGVFNPKSDEDSVQSLMCNQVLDLLAVLHTQEDSGSSIGYKLNLLNKLIRFQPLTNLTFRPDEFGNVINERSNTQIRQNKRLSSVFANTNRETQTTTYNYIDGLCKKDYGYVVVDENNNYNIEYRESHACCTGGAFIIMKNGSLRWSNLRTYIKDTSNFDPDKSFTVPQYQIEYPNGWWISFVKEEDLKEALEVYDIKIEDKTETAKRLYEEIREFKNGQYEQELTNRINFLIGELRSGKNQVAINNLLNYVKTKRATRK